MIRSIFEKPRLSFRFTPTGKKTLFLVLIVGAGALNSGVNLLYLVFALLLGAIIASGVLSGITLWDVKASLGLPERIFALEPFYGTVKAENLKKRFASYSLWIKETNHRILGKGIYFPRIPSRRQSASEFDFTFSKRGKVDIKKLQILTRFPFGFFEKTISIQTETSLLVYPKIISVDRSVAGRLGDEGLVERLQKGLGLDLYNLRDYQPGDHPKHIHWKSTAHQSALMIREFSSEEESDGILVFDNTFTATGPESISQFEAGVCLVASAVNVIIKEGMQLDFAAWGSMESRCRGEEGLFRILTVLALIEPLSREETAVMKSPESVIAENSRGKGLGLVFGFGEGRRAGPFERLDLCSLTEELEISSRMNQ